MHTLLGDAGSVNVNICANMYTVVGDGCEHERKHSCRRVCSVWSEMGVSMKVNIIVGAYTVFEEACGRERKHLCILVEDARGHERWCRHVGSGESCA